ncbi:MAG: lipase maturation factor family protein [Candidatus Omnitrophica bacterium]|nr:lipase maturation factor family protein [Candidatus Omnitrophota bacterium]MCB9781880.1 lipase maturation factor family protein [Candidatus Omnitrophota bacterium]
MRWKSDDTYCFASFWFLRILGLAYLSAFLSLWVQLDGLIGSRGILPAQDFIEAVRNLFGDRLLTEGIWAAPSVFLFGSSDSVLHWGCALGSFLSGLFIIGFAPNLTALALWILYLSFTTVAGTFFGFQWDNLLLEMGFLAIFLPPLRVCPRFNHGWRPRIWVLWLYRFLLFRLMFSSGFVKLQPEGAGPNTWADLTALNYHYETQPLPTLFAWYAHQLPEWFDKMSVALTLFIQIVIPFLIFGPRICRRAASACLLFLQVLILLTGNYCFFNLLAIGLCLLLLDDRLFRNLLRGWNCKIPVATFFGRVAWVNWARRVGGGFLFVVLLSLGVYQLCLTVGIVPAFMRPVATLDQIAGPFRTFNTYGLFANMTTSRPEIIVQGSRDGIEWKDYEFKYKPGDLSRRPKWNAPHQPRLDWQMWFAALGNVRSSRNQWFLSFLKALLEGRKEVIGLLETNPFEDSPPKYVRALVYDYHFTRWGSGDPNWWERGEASVYCPPVTLDESGRLRAQ